MDYRLDMFNSVKKYLSNIDENDAILVLMHNKKDGDCFTALGGDWEILSSLFSVQFNSISNVSLSDTRSDNTNSKNLIL